METTRALMPRARKDELVVEELPDETLVYDLKRHKAHCLNPTAALVWQHCDGRTTSSDMAEILEQELELPRDEQIVWFAIDRLRKAKLLDKREDGPAKARRYSRRDLVRKLAVVGGLSVLLPVVSSIKSPLAAQAGSTTTNRDCRRCVGLSLPCSDRPGRTCTPRAGKLKKDGSATCECR